MCYLPPSSSSRGDCAEQFLDCLGAQITLYRNFGTVCVCGDFNARCGNLQDISLLCDTEIPPHKVLDVERNSHGKQFIKQKFRCYEAKIEESEKAGSRRESNPGHLACAASALPLSYDNRTTTSPHNPLYVLHRWD